MPAEVSRRETSSVSSERPVSDDSHECDASMVLELVQEASIVAVQQPEVADAVAHHRHAIETEAECEAGVALAVVADVLEHDRMDHPAAEHLDEAGVLAHAARRRPLLLPAPADRAADVDLATGLDEPEVAR